MAFVFIRRDPSHQPAPLQSILDWRGAGSIVTANLNLNFPCMPPPPLLRRQRHLHVCFCSSHSPIGNHLLLAVFFHQRQVVLPSCDLAWKQKLHDSDLLSLLVMVLVARGHTKLDHPGYIGRFSLCIPLGHEKSPCIGNRIWEASHIERRTNLTSFLVSSFVLTIVVLPNQARSSPTNILPNQPLLHQCQFQPQYPL
jgi:hypothetical protein